ncbi:MAG: hypothetical protein OQK51_24125 [Kangiellaceae bacterium]|nr:hypothetical protein [Kangiellaceae bacterium]
MKFYQLVFLLSTAVLGGCAGTSHVTSDNMSLKSDETAVLTDYDVKNGFITIQAVGYGCTFFDSFKVKVSDRENNELKVVRTRPDECGMKPRNISLQYSFKHLGLDLNKSIQVKNPVLETTERLSTSN